MIKRSRKRWVILALAGLLALPAAGPAWEAEAAPSGTGRGSYVKSGTYHIDQFGEYDIQADVTVENSKITEVEITGSNFGGTYAEVNKGKLQTAIDGIADKFPGLSDDDGEGIRSLDAVTGATYSSNGIKEAVADALGLELAEDSAGGVPAETPEPGIYEVTVAVRSDVVDHSLVQTETAEALLTVEENGQMTLSYTMVSGTEQEPMYILGFNGYYQGNDPANPLSMEGVTYQTEERGDYTVVTDVTFPLTGLDRYYYNNTRIYVPAMSNLNGEINGIHFENGQFSVKTIVTVYWDTLAEHGAGEEGRQSMEITAHIAEQMSEPSGMVQIPSSISMGKLKTEGDNVQPYEICISADDQNQRITVRAPEGGQLYSGREELPFANDFGTQTAGDPGTAKAASGEAEVVLNGNITIRGADVAAAAPGNYTGTTTFTITYDGKTEDPDSGKEPDDQKDPDSGEDPDDQKDPGKTELDIHNLEDGVYAVTGKMVKADQSTLSMADNAINHTIKLTVKDGLYSLTLDMKGMDISGKQGYLGRLQYFLTGYTKDRYGYPQGELGDAEVESYQTDENGDRIRDDYGTDYPDLVSFELIPEAREDGFVPLQVYVPVMDSISQGLGDQSVYLALDWATLKAADEDDPAFTDDEEPGNTDDGSSEGPLNSGGGLTGGSNLGGNSLGGSSLGGSSLGSGLGGSSLGSGSLGGSSLGGNGLKSASGVRTDDSSANPGIWIPVLAAGCICLGAGMVKAVRSGRRWKQHERKQRQEKA